MQQKKNNSNKRLEPQNAYFSSLELKNIRCFSEEQKISFSSNNGDTKQWTIILGDNGTGKTTILQGLVSMLPLPSFTEDKSFVILYPFVIKTGTVLSQNWKHFREKTTSEVKVDFVIQDSLKSTVGSDKLYLLIKGEDLWNDGQGATSNLIMNCFAYGASRKAGKTSLSEKNEESSYITLFDESALLINPEEWLLQADYASNRESEFKEERKRDLKLVNETLIKILPDIDEIKFNEVENGRTPKPTVEFHTPYGWVESKDLSLGYRTSMAWVVDFASRMFNLYPESENPLAEPAVVLVDEIDLHLHPKWQRELIDYLTNLFPNTQFIVTTHSPLIVQAAAARDANIVVCRREGDHVVIDQSVEAVKNWRADQILTSELFDLPTARPKKIEPFLEERQEILSKAKITKKDEKRLKELEDEIGFMPVSEDNPEDDKAMDIIRRAAERLQSEVK